MADDNKTFQELLKQQRETNERLGSLSQDNKLNRKLLSDIENDTPAEIVASAEPETSTDTRNVIGQTAVTKAEFDQQQDIFRTLNANIRAMGNVIQQGVEQDAKFQAKQDAKAERQEALKESGEDTGLEDGKEEFGKDLKEGVGGVFGALRGIFFGTAGIFAAIYLFVAALGNEKFRNVVFKATDAVKQAFGDFDDLINGEMGLMEFLKENALTIAAITTLLMPLKTFGLLKAAALGLPKALISLGAGLKVISTFFSKTILPIFGPIIRVMGSVIAVLFGLKKGVEDGLAMFKETGNVLDSINFAIASFLGFIVSLPAQLFTTLIDGALGLLEFFSFGFLNFDDIQQTIRDMDFANFMRDLFFDFFNVAQDFIQEKVLNAGTFILDLGIRLGGYAEELLNSVVSFAKGIGKKIYDPETGAIFGKVLPPFPTLGDIGGFLKEKAKTIYDPDTNAIFGYQLPELPSIDDMFSVLADFAKKIYNPETGEIFGFKLPSLSDLNPFQNFSLFGNDSFEDLQEDANDAAKDAAEKAQKADDALVKFQETGNDKFLKKYEKLSQDAIELQEKAGNLQYQALMKKMEENGELTDAERSIIQQINVVKGGDSVNQQSSTGFSTIKSAQNDDYTVQALAGSMP
jgi:hypothetical protein